MKKQRAPNGKNSPCYISQLRSGNHPQHLWLQIFSLDVSPTVTRQDLRFLSAPAQSALNSHACWAPSTGDEGREGGRAEPLLVTLRAVDPVVGRHVAGPRGGSAWEERGGCHPCVVWGVCPPSTGYMVGLLRHVSPTTSLSPCFLHVLSPTSRLPTSHRVPPQACPGPPTSRASPSLRPQCSAYNPGCQEGVPVWITGSTPAEAATAAAETMQQSAEGGEQGCQAGPGY